MKEILLVAPYSDLEKLAKDLQASVKVLFDSIVAADVPSEGNLDQNFAYIKERTTANVKIVVSRGGTAQYLKRKLKVPVIEIPVTSFDILRSIENVSKKGYKKIAFITTSNIMLNTEHFNEIMGVTLHFESCEKVSQIPEKVKRLISEHGVDAIVGDFGAYQEALRNGIYGELLESGSESIKNALLEAKKVLELNKRERARVSEVETILNMIDEGVLVIDKNEIVTIYNHTAEKIFGTKKEDVLGKRVKDSLPASKLREVLYNNESERNIIYDLDDKKIVTNRIPIIIDGELQGAVAIFEEIKSIQKLEMKIRRKLNEKGLVAKHSFERIISNTQEMKDLVNQAKRFAKSEGTVLIYGETGTGKEVFAQSIHSGSLRADGPFVSINCAALNENLLESELFGYEEGTFTGALKGGKAGLFELAHRGTLFLDEIGETSLSFQAKLLRALQEKEIRKIGGDKVIPIDVRVICATNRNLKKEVMSNRFREDLYYRLSVLELSLPPLRKRTGDIIPMAISFLNELSAAENKKIYWLKEDVFAPLLSYGWYGNARELKNFIERLVICSTDNELTGEFLDSILQYKFEDETNRDQISINVSGDLKQMESEILMKMLERYNGDRERLCKEYNISRTTLWRKMCFKNEN